MRGGGRVSVKEVQWGEGGECQGGPVGGGSWRVSVKEAQWMEERQVMHMKAQWGEGGGREVSGRPREGECEVQVTNLFPPQY